MNSAGDADEISVNILNQAVSWRRHLHQHPELAYQERQTADFVAAQLTQFGLSIHRGLAGTGVVGTLTRGTSRRAIGIRADMDALPIQEQSGVPHASTAPSVMHACGHDGHVAMLLTAAAFCAQDSNLDGTVHFIFQPAEENEGGGRRMVEEGLFRLFPCDTVYALHNWPALPLGTCVAREGAMLAAFATFEIVVSGRGCHGALPHEGTDCVLAACQLVSALHTIVSRNIDPRQAAVLSITQINAGDTWNTIPNSVTIRGTTRWFDGQVGDTLERRLTELANAIAGAFGCHARVHYERRSPATINDSDAAAVIRAVVANPGLNLTMVDIEPSTGSEDFAFMLQEVPGCYLLLGAGRSGDNPALHSSHYDFNDEVLPLGAGLWVQLVRQTLTRV